MTTNTPNEDKLKSIDKKIEPIIKIGTTIINIINDINEWFAPILTDDIINSPGKSEKILEFFSTMKSIELYEKLTDPCKRLVKLNNVLTKLLSFMNMTIINYITKDLKQINDKEEYILTKEFLLKKLKTIEEHKIFSNIIEFFRSINIGLTFTKIFSSFMVSYEIEFNNENPAGMKRILNDITKHIDPSQKAINGAKFLLDKFITPDTKYHTQAKNILTAVVYYNLNEVQKTYFL